MSAQSWQWVVVEIVLGLLNVLQVLLLAVLARCHVEQRNVRRDRHRPRRRQ